MDDNLSDRVYLGQAVYSRFFLNEYDRIVSFSARFLWRCSWPKLVRMYTDSVSGNHLDVGVGSGHFLDNCIFPVDSPRIVLFDLNPNSLEFTRNRIRRYSPSAYQTNVLEPIRLETDPFDSIGINYLLHCLPGTLASKAPLVFKNLRPLLKPGGVIFGSTILGEAVRHNYLGRVLMEIYNNTGAFDNWQDNARDLRSSLESQFRSYQMRIIGCTALFKGRI